jgi:hypothetical protein
MEYCNMKRFNYHQSTIERLLAGVPAAALAEHLRTPLAVIGAALLTVAATGSIETHRAAGLEAELTSLQDRVHAAAANQTRAERLTVNVARLRTIAERITVARRDVLVTTNTIASIGNGLPPQTWLTSVASTPAGDWTIGGRSTRVDEIGTMLRRVQGIDRGTTARLVSIAATGRAARVLDFVIGWDHRP